MLVLERKGDEVFCNGQKWVSLSKLKEGLNEIECNGREVSTSKAYVLTEEEKAQVAELQSQIDAIIEVAKARYVAKPKLNIDPSKLSEEERVAYIANLEKYIATLKG